MFVSTNPIIAGYTTCELLVKIDPIPIEVAKVGGFLFLAGTPKAIIPSAHVIVLPDDAIGIGGTWSIRSDQVVGFSETRWTIVKRDGDRITLIGTMIQTSRPNKEGSEGSGTARAVIDLKRPAPVDYEANLVTTVTYVTNSGTIRQTESSQFQFNDGGM